MVLLVLTSCRMKDTKQTYPEGITQQQTKAVGQSETHEEKGLSRKPAAGDAKAAGVPDWKGREPLSEQYKTWEPVTGL